MTYRLLCLDRLPCSSRGRSILHSDHTSIPLGLAFHPGEQDHCEPCSGDILVRIYCQGRSRLPQRVSRGVDQGRSSIRGAVREWGMTGEKMPRDGIVERFVVEEGTFAGALEAATGDLRHYVDGDPRWKLVDGGYLKSACGGDGVDVIGAEPVPEDVHSLDASADSLNRIVPGVVECCSSRFSLSIPRFSLGDVA